MSVTRNDPNTVFLGGPRTILNNTAAGIAIVPGYLVERYVPSGTINRWKPHATAGGDAGRYVATEQLMSNKTVDDAYGVGDLVEVSQLAPGASAWMLIKSGVAVVYGGGLESAGDGTLRALASGTRLFTALETKTANVLTRIKVDVV